MKKQIVWADNLKVFGILLILWGHCFDDKMQIKHMIYSFHVPLFFFLSGYFFKPRKSFFGDKPFDIKQIFEDFKKKFVGILLPFWTYIIILLPFTFLFEKDNSEMSIINDMTQKTGNMSWNLALWFLPCLFFVWLFCYLLLSERRNFLLLVVMQAAVAIAYLTYPVPKNFQDFGILRMFSVVPFFILGFWFKKNDLVNKIKQRVPLYYFLMLTLPMVWYIFGVILNPKVSIYKYKYGNYLYLLVGATAAIIALVLVFSKFEKVNIITKMSSYTLFIMATHMVLIRIYKDFFLKYIKKDLNLQIFITLIASICVVLIGSAIGSVLGRKFPKAAVFLGIR